MTRYEAGPAEIATEYHTTSRWGSPDPHQLKVYCAICGYQLQGLRENRCPECGQAFDPNDLTRLPEPITIGQVIKHLLIPPALFWGAMLLLVVLGPAGAIVLIPVVIYQFFGGIVLARRLAERLAVTRSDGATSGLEQRTFILLCTIGLYCCQLLLGTGGCAVAVALSVL